jgi:hypothetical protein
MSFQNPRKKRNKRAPEFGQVPISEKSIWEISPSPENEKLYRPVDPDDPDVQTLATSIKENGLLEPMVITSDGYLISGHRRHAAALVAGVHRVPVRELDVSRMDDPDHFLRLLREHNRQRDKTQAEKLREEIVSMNPEEAYYSLVEHRQEQAGIDVNTITLRDYKGRSKISEAKQPFLDAVKNVISQRKQFWPLSDRQIHYALLNSPPLKHASKPTSRYDNSPRSYKALTELLTRARIEGEIPMEAIGDETRPVTEWRTYQSTRQFLQKELDDFLKNYWRDHLQSQPNHIELVVEKNTVTSIIKPVAMEYCLRLTSGRGFCSLPPRYEMLQRFEKSGKEKLVILFLSDFDPEGEEIPHSFARSLRDDFDLPEERIVPVKVALTAQQVREFNLPPILQAKKSSPNYQKFVKKYGTDAFELEAIPPETLQDLTRQAIDSVLDVEAFNKERDAEREDAHYLDAVRTKTRETLLDLID